MPMRRRSFIKTVITVLASLQMIPQNVFAGFTTASNNFKQIYSSIKLKGEFFKFLKNVFNLVPEDDLHKLISEVAATKKEDQAIYLEVQSKLEEITPLFSSFRYSLPSLMKQKDEMARKTLELLGEGGTYNGYLEIGSSGRYLDYLEEKVNIEGERYYADGKEPGYAITEMVDRGQINIGAAYI